MVLSSETKVGLTYGQIISTLLLLITIGSIYVSIKLDIQELRTEQSAIVERVIKMENVYIKLTDLLSKPITNEVRIGTVEKETDDVKKTVETMRKENREEHTQIINKLDKLIKR